MVAEVSAKCQFSYFEFLSPLLSLSLCYNISAICTCGGSVSNVQVNGEWQILYYVKTCNRKDNKFFC